MSSLRRIGVIVGHELRLVGRDPTPLLVLIVFPVITIAFLKPALQPALVQGGYPDATGAEQVVPGQAVMSAFFLVSLITLAFFAEHGWATWDRLRASPATSLEIIVGKALPRVAIGIIEFAVVLGAGALIFELTVRGSVGALVPLVVAFTLLPRAARRRRHRAEPDCAAGERVRVHRHGAVRCDRRRVRAVQRAAGLGPGGGAGHADLLGDARHAIRRPRRSGHRWGRWLRRWCSSRCASLFAGIAVLSFRFDEVKTGFA